MGAAVGAIVTAQYFRLKSDPAVITKEVQIQPQQPGVNYTPVEIESLPGWANDAIFDARPAMLRSCERYSRKSPTAIIGQGPIGRPASSWHTVCALLAGADSEKTMRTLMASKFSAYSVSAEIDQSINSHGTFTGYYEADLKGSMTRGGPYQTPIYGLPRNLVNVNLNDFAATAAPLSGVGHAKFVGRVVEQEGGVQLKPYYSRANIDADGVIAGDADVIVWARDPVDVHILHIQGSGRVTLQDGRIIRIGFAGSNGLSFRGIGGILLKAGVLKPGQGSMVSVRDWLKNNPKQAAKYMNMNARYIFFRHLSPEQTKGGPIGAFGVSLTPMRSIAVDPRSVPLGAPVWLDTHDPDGRPLQRLVAAQDVGSAIKGAVRGDFFWGHGPDAFYKAGRMKSDGQYFVFVPKQGNH
ncbi:MAG: murein transglycosylase [Candidatus Marinimicrobia bacterium]|nr:murein transglycosylase [Candidatus Neomarinimicrobiota bacterium]